jgi:hypothetical protein
MAAGVQYAIVQVIDSTLGSCWAGSFGDTYAAGSGWTTGDLNAWDPTTNTQLGLFDFAFRTYVG